MNRLSLNTLCIALTAAFTVNGCASLNSITDRGASRDANNQDTSSTKPLEVPPGLAKPKYNNRYVTAAKGDTISVKAMQHSNNAVQQASGQAPQAANELKFSAQASIKNTKEGKQLLQVSAPAAQVWPQVVSFLNKESIKIKQQDPKTGLITTDWIEGKSDLPTSWLQEKLNSVLPADQSNSDVKDQYTVIVQPISPTLSQIMIAHRGAEKVVSDSVTRWQNKPASVESEAKMLSKLRAYLVNPKR